MDMPPMNQCSVMGRSFSDDCLKDCKWVKTYLDSVEETESATRRFVEVVLPCLERLETIQE